MSKPWAWTADEEMLLELLAGTVPPKNLVWAYNKRAQASGGTIRGRNKNSIKSKLARLGISIRPDECNCYTGRAIAEGLGVEPRVISGWCKSGVLKHTRDGQDRLFVSLKDLCEFLAGNPGILINCKIDAQGIAFILGCFGAYLDLRKEQQGERRTRSAQRTDITRRPTSETKRLILEYVAAEPLTKKELAKRLHTTVPALTQVLMPMLKSGSIAFEEFQGPQGRPYRRYFNPNQRQQQEAA